jgi:hypothetical protein
MAISDLHLGSRIFFRVMQHTTVGNQRRATARRTVLNLRFK